LTTQCSDSNLSSGLSFYLLMILSKEEFKLSSGVSNIMAFSFIHCADLHLGFNQFGLDERFHDFDKSFSNIVDVACQRKVNYFLISGDIFNKRNINAFTLETVVKHLKRLNNNNITVIAIEGNHDKAFYQDRFSWMHYLAKNKYINLLKPVFSEGNFSVTAYDPLLCNGMVYEDEFVKIYGLGYFGNTLGEKIASLSEKIVADNRFTILMAHGGIGGIEIGRLSLDQLQPFYHLYDYFALGHQHSNHEYDRKVYIPGAPEYYDLGEVGKKKGFYFVEVDGKNKVANFIESKKRDALCLTFDAGKQHINENLDQIIAEIVHKASLFQAPLLRILFTGQSHFSLKAQDVETIRNAVLEKVGALYIEIIDNTGTEQTSIKYSQFAGSITAIERAIITEELMKDPKYSDVVPNLAEFIMYFKQKILDEPEAFLEELICMDMAKVLYEKKQEVNEITIPTAPPLIDTGENVSAEINKSGGSNNDYFQATLF